MWLHAPPQIGDCYQSSHLNDRGHCQRIQCAVSFQSSVKAGIRTRTWLLWLLLISPKRILDFYWSNVEFFLVALVLAFYWRIDEFLSHLQVSNVCATYLIL